MDDPKDMAFEDRLVYDRFLQEKLEYLIREKTIAEGHLERLPGDITAMSNLKKIQSDIAILVPLYETVQKQNLREIEKFTGKKFSFILNRSE